MPRARAFARPGMRRRARTHLRNNSRGIEYPRLTERLTLSKKKRRRERPGALRATRGLVCNVHKKSAHTSITVQVDTPRPPLRNWFLTSLIAPSHLVWTRLSSDATIAFTP